MQLSTQLCIQDKPRPHRTSVEPELYCNTTSIVARTQKITKKGKGCNLKILSLFNLIQTLSCTISLFKKDQNHNRYQVTPCKLSPQHSKHKSSYLHPTIIMATEKIFSPSVVGAMLPKPMVVRLVMVKYREVI